MPKVTHPYEVNGQLVTGNGSLIPICSLSNRSLLPSLTVHEKSARGGSFSYCIKKCMEGVQSLEIQ